MGPSVDDGMLVDVIDSRQDPLLQFLFGCDSDVAQDRARELGEEALDEIEPGAMRGREGEFEAADRLTGEPSLGLFGDVRGMIVEDQLDRRVGWIGGVEKLEKFDGMERWGGLGVIADNLINIGRVMEEAAEP